LTADADATNAVKMTANPEKNGECPLRTRPNMNWNKLLPKFSRADRLNHTDKDGIPTPPEWYMRGYLPHFDGGEIPQVITFRLFGSLPKFLLERWAEELAKWPEQKKAEAERRRRIEDYLDQGLGAVWLKDKRIGELTQNALRHFDGSRYRLHAWVVMPNHVHVLLTPQAEIAGILHSWKSFTSKKANKILQREGHFWQAEAFDRYVRDEKHFKRAWEYIEENPVKAGLCERPEAWPWSSAAARAHRRKMCDE
jgi:REP element-mobilizing transposase RayT